MLDMLPAEEVSTCSWLGSNSTTNTFPCFQSAVMHFEVYILEVMPRYSGVHVWESTSTMEIDLQSYKMLPFYEQANYALQAPHNQLPYQSPVLFSRVSKASTQCLSSLALAPSAQL